MIARLHLSDGNTGDSLEAREFELPAEWLPLIGPSARLQFGDELVELVLPPTMVLSAPAPDSDAAVELHLPGSEPVTTPFLALWGRVIA